MKQTIKSANFTSFHGDQFNATVTELITILGEPVYIDNTGEDKVNFEWEMETDNGDIFTVYDWKQYRPINENEIITWHIGGHSELITSTALNEIKKELNK